MRQTPSGADLLVLARATLEQKSRALSGDEKYAMSMVSNARRIAERKFRNGEQSDDDALLEILRSFNAPSTQSPRHDESRNTSLGANRDLVTLIRKGAADPGKALHSSTYVYLRQLTRRRAEQSAPGSLREPDDIDSIP